MKKYLIEILADGYKIIAAIFGVLISMSSMLLYYYFKSNLLLDLILSTICILYAGFQLYKLYFKDKKMVKIIKISLSLLFLVLYILIVYVIIMIFSVVNDKPAFCIDYLMYAIFTSPTFLLVILLAALIIYVTLKRF